MKDLKSLIQKLSLYICSFDFILSSLLTALFIFFVSHNENNLAVAIKDITKNFGYYIPLISIFITIFTLSITILITTISDKFLKYLEDHGKVFSQLTEYHKVGFLIYFMAIFLNILLQIGVNLKSEILIFLSNYLNFIYTFKEKIFAFIYIITIFLTIYSFFYTVSLLFLVLKLLEYRMKFYEKYIRR